MASKFASMLAPIPTNIHSEASRLSASIRDAGFYFEPGSEDYAKLKKLQKLVDASKFAKAYEYIKEEYDSFYRINRYTVGILDNFLTYCHCGELREDCAFSHD